MHLFSATQSAPLYICSRCTDHEVFFPAGTRAAHRVSVKYEIIGWAGRSLIRNGTPRACQLYCHFYNAPLGAHISRAGSL
jgi:hypothetical protein